MTDAVDDFADSAYLKVASEILPGQLYVSGLFPAASESIISALNIKRIISVTHSDPGRHHNVQYLHIKLHDEATEDIFKHFGECHSFIDEGMRNGQPTLVHCNMGMSRSVAVVLSYLIFKHNHTLKSAFAFIRERRPIISPNFGFLRQLAKYEASFRQQPESLDVIVMRVRELWDLDHGEFDDETIAKALQRADFDAEKLAYELYPSS